MRSKKNDGSSLTTGTSLTLPVPVRDESLFKYGATADVIDLLTSNPSLDFSVRQLGRLVSHSEKATRDAVDVLEANDLVVVEHRGNARRVHINRDRLTNPSDPIQSIPQPEFHVPVNLAREYLLDAVDDIAGIVLYGSVATGTADRQSDIDLWVLVEEDHLDKRHQINQHIAELEARKVPPTVPFDGSGDPSDDDLWNDVVQLVVDTDMAEPASGQRYSFDVTVESPKSFRGKAQRVDPVELFGHGIVLASSDLLDRIKREVLTDE